MKYTRFDIESAIGLIRKGWDGSEANRHALVTARDTLRKCADQLQDFASKKPGIMAFACNDKAQNLLDEANKVENLFQPKDPATIYNTPEYWESKLANTKGLEPEIKAALDGFNQKYPDSMAESELDNYPPRIHISVNLTGNKTTTDPALIFLSNLLGAIANRHDLGWKSYENVCPGHGFDRSHNITLWIKE